MANKTYNLILVNGFTGTGAPSVTFSCSGCGSTNLPKTVQPGKSKIGRMENAPDAVTLIVTPDAGSTAPPRDISVTENVHVTDTIETDTGSWSVDYTYTSGGTGFAAGDGDPDDASSTVTVTGNQG